MPVVAPPSPASRSRLGAGDPSALGDALHAFAAELMPLRRCITGDGLRQTLLRIGDEVPLRITEVASGTTVLDWTIPQEWRVKEAYVATADGERVIDWEDHPLHLVQYSVPARDRMPLWALRSHLHTLPDQPGLIPYRTSYYTPAWGFCLRQNDLDQLAERVGESGELEVVVDTELFDGSLTYGEVVVPGETPSDILLSAHACHPGLANDNVSSMAVATAVARRLLDGPTPRHTVRILFAPGTIGALAWLDRSHDRLGNVRAGLVLANLGDAGGFTYKRTRAGTLDGPLAVDRAVEVALRDRGVDVRPFEPTGYDERQFGSPGFDLPVGRLTRTPHGEYPEYHTSGDDLAFIHPEALAEAVEAVTDVISVLDRDGVYRNLQPFGEPQLGRRGLYAPMGGAPDPEAQRALRWVLNLSDGRFSLLDIAERSGLPFATVRTAADRLVEANLLGAA
ncbi:MAG: DUF4910 domain-containing protein [Bacteroidota bacterium]